MRRKRVTGCLNPLEDVVMVKGRDQSVWPVAYEKVKKSSSPGKLRSIADAGRANGGVYPGDVNSGGIRSGSSKVGSK